MFIVSKPSIGHSVSLLGMGGQVFLVEGHEVALGALKIYTNGCSHFYFTNMLNLNPLKHKILIAVDLNRP